MMELRKLFSKITQIVVFFTVFLFSAASASQIRSSISKRSDSPFWVAVDFNVGSDAHITAPVGKGKSTSPSFSWKNAEVLQTVWPAHINLTADGVYKGYDKNFSVLFLISPLDKNDVVKCDVFYVVCDDSCRPVQSSLNLQYDGKLTNKEIEQVAKLQPNSHDFMQFMIIIGMAFIGGIILNCMPCVFPVLSIKVFKVLKDYSHGNKFIKKQGVAFGAGVLSSFLTIGLILFYMKQMGTSIGWGFYMQNTPFVMFLLLVFLGCALYFFGIISIPNFNFVSKKRYGLYAQSFLNGVFTSVASGVCVGPFVGVAIGTALMYDNIINASFVFLALGLGVAAPFVSICFIPRLAKILPKPGEWMENLKGFMGFAMLFSCLWVLWVLAAQVSISRLMVIIASIISFSMFMWIWNKSNNSKPWKILAIIGVMTSVAFALVEKEPSNKSINWKEFSFENIENLKRLNKPVFVNVTASWCMTCGMNDLVLSNESVIDAFKKYNVQAVQADWTLHNNDITKFLSRYGSNSVPFSILYKPGNDSPIILSTILNADDLIVELGK